jgi:hypothetical protein
MAALCDLARDECFGLSGAVIEHPDSAPGSDVAAPTILCNVDVGSGARMLVVDGVDGHGRRYVSQVVFNRYEDGQVVPVREPAFWLGIVHTSPDVVGATSWTTARHPDPDATNEARAEELIERARLSCPGDD